VQYEKALDRFFEGKNVDIMGSAAKAYYQLGKTLKQADQLKCAFRLLQRALHIFPKDMTLWFNLAIVLQDHTAVMSSERMDKVTVEEMREAATLAELTIRNLTWLANKTSEQYDPHIAEQRAAYTRTVKEKLEKRIDELLQTQADRQKRLEEMISHRQQQEKAQMQAANQAEEVKQRELDDVLRVYEEMNAKIQEGMKAWDDVVRSAGGSRKPRAQRQEEDGFVVPDTDSDAEDSPVDDSNAESSGRKRSPTMLTDADDQPNSKRKRLKKKSERMGAQPLSAEFIEDSDEELIGDEA
jgi:RNA polymerase-associated protein CTR9